MSHQFLSGSIYHKRFTPKEHTFIYPFFMLNIDVSNLASLKNKLFSVGGFNLFSFKPKDHFGNDESFTSNIQSLQKQFGLEAYQAKRFITLPRIANFVFNPLSVVVLFDEDKPSHLLAEVNNYNGGRIVYPIELTQKANGDFEGKGSKDMYVSPFFQRDGEYQFTLHYSQERFQLSINYYKEDVKQLNATFSAKPLAFSSKSVAKLFARHSFLTFWVVTRTLWQTFRLKLKGLPWYSPTSIDQTRRY